MIPADASYRQRLLDLLGGREPLDSLEDTTRRIQDTAARLGPQGLSRPWAPGKWTGVQVLSHLADVEIAIGFRMRQILAEDGHRVQPFDQDKWAERYTDVDPELARRSLAAFRQWNLALIRRMTPQDLARRTVHPDRGEETLETVVLLLAGHDLNHLGQLEALLPGR
jgi:hypothetical protein